MSESHQHLIHQLGGSTAVAIDLFGGIGPGGRHRSRVSKWGRNGIPWKHRLEFVALARRRGVRLPENFLISAANDGEPQADEVSVA